MPTPYELMMEELRKQPPPPPPQFTPEQQQQRVQGNNQLAQLGLLGQMSGDRGINNVGGQVFKNALGAREERVTNRGVTNPLTGETALDPAYVQEQQQGRRGKVLEAALKFEDQRMRSEERADLQRQRAEDAKVLKMALAGNKSETTALRNDLLRAQIAAREAATNTAAQKRGDVLAKRKTALENQARQANIVLGKVEEAEKLISPMNTGAGAALSKSVPGLQYVTNVPDLEQTIDTIKANLGFDQLSQMRESSQTGGALGNVTVREIEFLQNTIASLDTRQRAETLRQNLKQVRESLGRVVKNFERMGLEVPEGLGGADIAAPSPEASGGGAPSAPGASPEVIRYERGPDGRIVRVQ